MTEMPAGTFNGAIPFTRVGVMLPFLSFLDRAGVPTTRYLRESKIPLGLLENPAEKIPLNLGYRFLSTACRAEGIEDVGLHVGRETSLNDLGEFGHYLLGSRNVLEYLQRGINLVGAVTSSDRYWLERQERWTRFCHRQDGPGILPYDRQQGYLFTLAVTINTIRRVAGSHWCPPELTLPALSRSELRALSEFLPDTRIITGSRDATFLLQGSLLGLPMPQMDSHDSSGMTAPPSLNTPLPADFVSSVELLIESLIMEGYPDIATAAEAAGSSVRSFRRRLAEFGTNYSDLVTRTRIIRAEQLLAESDRPISEIAFEIGYTDRSNFTRAFRRMNGMSPSEYRDHVTTENSYHALDHP